ncbi:MAG: LysR family transcriptional regulator [Clostridiales bacterium]|nr:LysR family transcriptional regulator [Clostridiales bacterium]
MNSEVLNTFVSLLELSSFTKAAQHLKITQSAVTKRIDALEAEMGTCLLVRNRKSVIPTAKGKVFFDYAKSILELEALALAAVDDSRACQERVLVGSVTSLFLIEVSEMIISFMQEEPSASIEIINNHSKDLLNLLYDDKLDVCFSHFPFKENNYTCKEIMQDELILVTAPKNDCYPNGITPEQLRTLPLIQDNCSYIADPEWFEYIFSGSGEKVLRVGVGSFAIPFLQEGIGYGFISVKQARPLLNDGKLTRINILEHKPFVYKGYLIYKTAVLPSTKRFIEYILNNTENQ